jgi:hypothetical protein
LGLHHESRPIPGQVLSSSFLQAAVAGPIQGIDFLQKFKVTFAPEISPVLFCCTEAAPVAALASLCSAQLEYSPL